MGIQAPAEVKFALIYDAIKHYHMFGLFPELSVY